MCFYVRGDMSSGFKTCKILHWLHSDAIVSIPRLPPCVKCKDERCVLTVARSRLERHISLLKVMLFTIE
jgi:hypothetical protein